MDNHGLRVLVFLKAFSDKVKQLQSTLLYNQFGVLRAGAHPPKKLFYDE